MTQKEMLYSIKNNKLDDYTMDLIANRLGINISNQQDGLTYRPAVIDGMSEKQSILRMLTKQFVKGDIIADKKNFMNYVFEISTTDWQRFRGKVDLDLMKKSGKQEFDITVPQTIADERICDLSYAFQGTAEYRINLNIEARGIVATRMLNRSGVTTIPDFEKIGIIERPVMFYGDTAHVYSQIRMHKMEESLSNQIMSMPNITPQQIWDFTLEHYNQDNTHSEIAKELANQYFCITLNPYAQSEYPQFITLDDVKKTNNTLELLSENASREDKVRFCAQHIISASPFERDVSDVLKEELGVKSDMDLTSMYLSNVKPSDVKISCAELSNKGEPFYLYLIRINDNVSVLYNSQTNELQPYNPYSKTDPINNNLKHYKFNPIQQEAVEKVLNDIKLKYSEIAKDVLTGDSTHIPTTQLDDGPIEK